jgi:diguanylate cyclase (GGDEF)-like protein
MTESEQTALFTRKGELGSVLSKQEPYLVQICGGESGRMYKLPDQAIKIGRSPQCQIIPDDTHVSRCHAEIFRREGGEIWIRDLGSANGVFVNGVKVTEQALTNGDKILIGSTLYFKFVYQDGVEQAYQENLYRAAHVDSLTQLFNRKYFLETLAKEMATCRRIHLPLGLLLIDIDRFKQINDRHGHIAGDLVLETVGQTLNGNLRAEDVASRYGGEEFAVLLKDTTPEQVKAIAERLRKKVESLRIIYREQAIPVTVSIGAANLDQASSSTLEDFLQLADDQLYRAKATGRNRTEIQANSKPGTAS